MVRQLGSETGIHERTDSTYERAVLGLKNYWWPVLSSKEVREKPVPAKLGGEDVVFLRRSGRVYALSDHCAHRGVPLSQGRHEFKDSTTITCSNHGFTYDCATGVCVAALTDGPDSPVVGKARVRTYPVEERKGIVWIWMGRMPPVPVDQDIPDGILDDDNHVMVRIRGLSDNKDKVRPGNWRYHAENTGVGHFPVLHRYALSNLLNPLWAHTTGAGTIVREEADGLYIVETAEGLAKQATYPGLGVWPPARPWRRFGIGRFDEKAEPTTVSMRLPGIVRVTRFPTDVSVYYEWWVPVDESHYQLTQIIHEKCGSIFTRLWRYLKYRAYVTPLIVHRLIDQDGAVVQAQTEKAIQDDGANPMSRDFRPDSFPLAFIDLCNKTARGEVQGST